MGGTSATALSIKMRDERMLRRIETMCSKIASGGEQQMRFVVIGRGSLRKCRRWICAPRRDSPSNGTFRKRKGRDWVWLLPTGLDVDKVASLDRKRRSGCLRSSHVEDQYCSFKYEESDLYPRCVPVLTVLAQGFVRYVTQF